jgi:hypothetical protein
MAFSLVYAREEGFWFIVLCGHTFFSALKNDIIYCAQTGSLLPGAHKINKLF